MTESWSGPVRVTKADGTVRIEKPLSPRAIDRMAAKEVRAAMEARRAEEAVEKLAKSRRKRRRHRAGARRKP